MSRDSDIGVLKGVRKKPVVLLRKPWSKADEQIIREDASAFMDGRIKATRLNIFSVIDRSPRLRKVAREEGRDRLFENIKSLKKSLK